MIIKQQCDATSIYYLTDKDLKSLLEYIKMEFIMFWQTICVILFVIQYVWVLM